MNRMYVVRSEDISEYETVVISMPTNPIPNSSQFVLPTICAPEDCNNRTTVASKGETKSTEEHQLYNVKNAKYPPLNRADEHVVLSFFVHILSFSEIGRPPRAREDACLSSKTTRKARVMFR